MRKLHPSGDKVIASVASNLKKSEKGPIRKRFCLSMGLMRIEEMRFLLPMRMTGDRQKGFLLPVSMTMSREKGFLLPVGMTAAKGR